MKINKLNDYLISIAIGVRYRANLIEINWWGALRWSEAEIGAQGLSQGVGSVMAKVS